MRTFYKTTMSFGRKWGNVGANGSVESVKTVVYEYPNIAVMYGYHDIYQSEKLSFSYGNRNGNAYPY